jgi:hypothetical protein
MHNSWITNLSKKKKKQSQVGWFLVFFFLFYSAMDAQNHRKLPDLVVRGILYSAHRIIMTDREIKSLKRRGKN